MPTCQHCSGAETTVPCPSTLFDEATVLHINTDISGEDSPELPHFIPIKDLPLHQCFVSCIYCSFLLAFPRSNLHYFFALLYLKALLSHFGGKLRDVGAPCPPAAAQGCVSSQKNELWFSLLLKPRHSTNTLVKTRSEPMQVFPGVSGAHRGIFQRLAKPTPIPTAPAGTGAVTHCDTYTSVPI